MRVQIKNKHCFQWLKAYIIRLQHLLNVSFDVFDKTDANVRIERIEAHFNKYNESFYIEYSDFANEKRYTIKIRISEYKLTKSKHNIY